MNDTITIHQTFTMPAIKGVKATPIDVNGYAVVNSDSLRDVLSSVSDSLSLHKQTLEQLVTKVEELSEYSVGFDDSIGVIAIPLLIALFAFAFTFLFTVITRINNDFESVPISRMFASSKPYKMFMQTSIGSAFFIIVVGLISLLLNGTAAHQWLMIGVNYLTLLVALVYTIVIFVFVKTCIQYNDPLQLIDLIDERYAEDMRGVQKYLKKQKKEEQKNEKEKSEHRKYFKNMGFWYGRVYAGFNAEKARIDRLVDLFKYALRKKNDGLALGVIQRVSSLIKEEKRAGEEKDIHLGMEFFDKAIDVYLTYPQNKKLDQDLMLYWSSSFNRAQLPSVRYVYRTLKMMVDAVTLEHYSLFEEYVSHVSYAFGYVKRLPVSCYVRGGTVEEQIKADEKRLDFWQELRDMHYLVASHVFSLGHFEVLRTLMYRKDKGFTDLFPNTGIEVLKLYARCKSNQTDDYNYRYLVAQDVLGDYPDPEMLEKYTAALLLMAPTKFAVYDALISSELLGIIKNNKDTIVQFGQLWQSNEIIQRQSSIVATQNIDQLIDQYIEVFEKGPKQVNDKIKEKGVCTRLLQAMTQFFCGVGESRDIYDAEICEQTKKNIGIHYWNWLYGNKSSLGNGLDGSDDEKKTSVLPLGTYTYLANKLALCKPDGPDVTSFHNSTTKVFSGRFQKLFFQAIQGMKMKDVRLGKEELGEYIADVLRDKGKDFVIVEVDLTLVHLVKLDKQEKRSYPWYNRFQEADIHPFELDTDLYMTDCLDLEPFRNSLLIIRKDDLPALERESEEAEPIVSYKDESNREKGLAAVRVTVDPRMVVKFNPESEVMRIKLTDYMVL